MPDIPAVLCGRARLQALRRRRRARRGVARGGARASASRWSARAAPGKTTLLRCFNRLTDPDEGRVLVDGADAAALDPIALRRRHRVRAAGRRAPAALAGAAQRRAGALARGAMAPPRARPTGAALVGLEPGALRRAAGRASCRAASGSGWRWPARSPREPDVVLLDEPFGALDAITRAELQEAFLALRRELGLTAVLVTHDLHEAFLLADRVAVLRAGAIEQVGRPGRAPRRARDAYVRELLRAGAGAPVSAARARCCCSRAAGRVAARPVVVASKPFGESYLLAEMFAQLLEARGHRGGPAARARRHRDRVPRAADRRDRRLSRVHRHRPAGDPRRAARARSARGLRPGRAASSAGAADARWLPPLGFENTYAIAVRRETARAARAARR